MKVDLQVRGYTEEFMNSNYESNWYSEQAQVEFHTSSYKIYYLLAI